MVGLVIAGKNINLDVTRYGMLLDVTLSQKEKQMQQRSTILCCLSASCVLCTLCCQCLCVVHFWLVHMFSIKLI